MTFLRGTSHIYIYESVSDSIGFRREKKRLTELVCVISGEVTPDLKISLNCAHVLSCECGRQVNGYNSANRRSHAAQFVGIADRLDNDVWSSIVWQRWTRASLLICHIDAVRPPKSDAADGTCMAAQAPASDTHRRESRRAAICPTYTRRYVFG